MPVRLPTITHKGKTYFIDWRLKEFRSVAPPLVSIPFDSELGREIDSMPEPENDVDDIDSDVVICPKCRKTVVFYCTKCYWNL
jgi:hypothetical protein